VLEEREVTPLGEAEPVALDVRLVAAAQRPLRAEVRAGRFREDLLTRLGVTLRIPPLRERLEDTAALFVRFLEQSMPRVPQLQARFVESLLQYKFPKNVRELRQLADWISTMYPNEPLLRRSHLPEWLRGSESGQAPEPKQREEFPNLACPAGDAKRSVVAAPRRAPTEQDLPRLLASLELHRGNVVKAADAVGLSRHQAYRLLRGRPEVSLEGFRRIQVAANDKSEPAR
jgi:DNA-binding NtrC family response regulator